jgi:hypothetical protein
MHRLYKIVLRIYQINICYHILLLLQNISKSELKKVDVFGLKFGSNTFTFIDKLLFIFCNKGSI